MQPFFRIAALFFKQVHHLFGVVVFSDFIQFFLIYLAGTHNKKPAVHHSIRSIGHDRSRNGCQIIGNFRFQLFFKNTFSLFCHRLSASCHNTTFGAVFLVYFFNAGNHLSIKITTFGKLDKVFYRLWCFAWEEPHFKNPFRSLHNSNVLSTHHIFCLQQHDFILIQNFNALSQRAGRHRKHQARSHHHA